MFQSANDGVANMTEERAEEARRLVSIGCGDPVGYIVITPASGFDQRMDYLLIGTTGVLWVTADMLAMRIRVVRSFDTSETGPCSVPFEKRD